MIPFGVWLVVTDPCPGCGKRLTGGARRKLVGERSDDGSWRFWVAWQFTCHLCGHCEFGTG